MDEWMSEAIRRAAEDEVMVGAILCQMTNVIHFHIHMGNIILYKDRLTHSIYPYKVHGKEDKQIYKQNYHSVANLKETISISTG